MTTDTRPALPGVQARHPARCGAPRAGDGGAHLPQLRGRQRGIRSGRVKPTIVVENDDGATWHELSDEQQRVVREVRQHMTRSGAVLASPADAVAEIIDRFTGRWDSEFDLREEYA